MATETYDTGTPDDIPVDPVPGTPGPLALPEYNGVVTTTPAANLASRSNIVADGPGTVGDQP